LAYISVADSMGLSFFNFVQWAPKDIFCATECVFAVQGHSRSMILVPIESAYATSYLSPIVAMVLSRTVSEIRRLIG